MHFKKQKTLRFKPMVEIDLKAIPDPLLWHFIVQPYEPEDVTTGGFILTEVDTEEYKKAHCVGRVIKMGELCFSAEAFKGTRPFEVGDVVFFARHNGMWMNWDGTDIVLLADDRVALKMDESLLVNFDGFQNHYEPYKD